MNAGSSKTGIEDLATKDMSKTVQSWSDFKEHYETIVMNSMEPTIVVTQELFNYLCKDKTSKSLTYGDPGVRVFIEGTEGKLLAEENMPAHESYTKNILKKSSQAV